VLATIARERGDHQAARAYYEERLTIARAIGNTWGVAESLYYLGLLARGRGEGVRARAFWTEGLSLFQRLGDKPRVAECLEGLASLAAPLEEEAGQNPVSTGIQQTPPV
jgi:hypothetical protein